jgi:hypothetical protein
VTQAEDALAIAFRTGLPFVGLRDHAHDPDLDRLVPPDAARTARAIPLTADDDRIRLAVADPDTDLSTLDRYLAGRQVDLALAPSEEIDTILGPPPPPGEEPSEAATDAPEAEHDPPTEAAGTEAEPSAEPEPLVADQETERVGEPEPLVGEEAAGTEHTPPEPQAVAAEAAPEPVVGEEAAGTEHTPPEPEPVAAEAAPEPVAPESAPEPVAAEAAPAPVAAAPTEHAAVSDVDAELAGEVPSWLEPRRRRWWRVVLAVVIILVLLAVAAVAVVAFVNA